MISGPAALGGQTCWPPGGWDAGDVLFAGLCVPGCMLAMETVAEECQCRCEGRFHAVLLSHRIPDDLWPLAVAS